MKTKQCTKCGAILQANLDNFHKDKEGKYGLHPKCKKCVADKRKQYYLENSDKCKGYRKKNADKNREIEREKAREYHNANRDIINERHKQHRKDNLIQYIARNKRFYDAHREERIKTATAWKNKTYPINPKYRIKIQMANRMRQSLRKNKDGMHWETLVGYTLKELTQRLESLFQPGMTWDNYGKDGWHIDHIRPIASFNFTSTDDPEFRGCWAITNLQPLWALDNIKKGAKMAVNF